MARIKARSSRQFSDDSDLPDYARPELRALAKLLELCEDVYDELTDLDCKARYLAQYPDEDEEEYETRLKRAVCPSDFRDAIHGYSALLSQFNVINMPASMERRERNIDRNGGTIASFWQRAIASALRHGGCAIFTDSLPLQAPSDRPLTRADALAADTDPYWVLYPRDRVLNWSHQGSLLAHVTLLEYAEVAGEGYGAEFKAQYRVLRPGVWELHEIVKTAAGQMTDVIVDGGDLAVPYIPVAWFSIEEDTAFGEGRPPLVTLARRCLQEMALENDLECYLHTVSHPIPVEVNNPRDDSKLLFGPNRGVSLPEGGNFFFAEPSGGSLTQQREHLAVIRSKIQQATLSFLHGGAVERTATEAVLSAGSVGASLMGLARQLKSTFEEAASHWLDISGEDGDRVEIELSPQTLLQPLTPEQVDRLYKALDYKVLSIETVLNELIAGRVVRSAIDPAEELQRIQEESNNQMQPQLPAAQDFGFNLGQPQGDPNAP